MLRFCVVLVVVFLCCLTFLSFNFSPYRCSDEVHFSSFVLSLTLSLVSTKLLNGNEHSVWRIIVMLNEVD